MCDLDCENCEIVNCELRRGREGGRKRMVHSLILSID